MGSFGLKRKKKGIPVNVSNIRACHKILALTLKGFEIVDALSTRMTVINFNTFLLKSMK